MRTAAALGVLLDDMRSDQAGYTRLHELLDAQFQAALRHRAGQLSALAIEIVALVEQLEMRREQRSQLLSRLLGRDTSPSMSTLLRRLPAELAQRLTILWQGLEQQVRECKQLNLRNCHLITEQQALMQRVLGVEEQVYAER